jgi:hypothetical protein
MSAMTGHPCPKPTIRKRSRLDGQMWACGCGLVYVLRFHFNYAGEWWEWEPTGLRTTEGGVS